MTIKKILLLGLILFCQLSYAKDFLPKNQPVPGGIALLPIFIDNSERPTAYYQDKQVTVIKGTKTPWLAIVGIPLDAKVGQHFVTVKSPINKTLLFEVKNKRYKQQHLHIKNKRKVTPNKQDLTQIKKDHKEFNSLLKNWSSVEPFQTNYHPPLRGPITSQFGLQRLFNGKLKSRHTGLDIAAPKGTRVKAPAAGVVLAVDNYFYTGNTILLDHGQGVFTLYGHLNDFAVKKGRHVAKGTVIGHVGQTGRATGPHLHWGLIINQTRVDPTLLVSKKAVLPDPPKKKKKQKRAH